MPNRSAALVCTVIVLALPAVTHAQSASEWVAKGNAAYDARNATEALGDFEKALAADPHSYDALWLASRSGVDLGEGESDGAKRAAIFKTAEERARLAVQANAAGADGHFALARALGRTAQTLGKRDQVKYAGIIRDEALKCLAADPKHAGCMHVMGEWNAEVMRLSGFTRMFAKTFLGGAVFNQASWANARRYLEQAVAADPRRIVHRLDLGEVYLDIGMKDQARTEFQAVVSGELIDYNDPRYKARAAADLKDL